MICHGETVAVLPINRARFSIRIHTYVLYSILPPTMIVSSMLSFILCNSQFEFDKDLILIPASEKTLTRGTPLQMSFAPLCP